jgi:flagellar motility protein MotE (MotC chaperone)
MSDKKLTKEQADALYDDMQRALAGMLTRSASADKKQAQPRAVMTPNNANKAPSQAAPTKRGEAAALSGYQNAAKVSQGVAARGARGEEALKLAEPLAANRTNDVRPRALPNRFNLKGLRFAAQSRGGQGLALMVLVALGCAKVALSAIDASGLGRVDEAQAVVVQRAPFSGQSGASREQWSKEEVKILKGLDARRVELEERSVLLDKREGEFSQKERALAIRLSELKELTERLKLERDKGEKQRNGQLDQLANVYGSMNPPEAAHLLEQLDIQVALSLIERMPEKRMAQILALMNSQRALEITNLLSSRVGRR